MHLHSQRQSTLRTNTRTRIWWCLCWLLLALAPVLGQMHHVLHGGHGAVVFSALQAGEHSANADSVGIAQLFGQHGVQDCQLLDQWTWAHPPSITLTVPRLVPVPLVPLQAYRHPALQTTIVFQARAPPALSQT